MTSPYDADYFADLEDRYRRRTRFARRRIANVLSLLPPLAGLRVVDLGTGMGTFAVEIGRREGCVTGIDSAAAALEAARRVAAAEEVAVGLVCGDLAALPIRSGSVDLALAADVTEHLDDFTLTGALGEVRRILRPGGTLVLYTPNGAHVFERLRAAGILPDADRSHIGLRNARELAAAVATAGLRVVHLRHLPSHLAVWNLLERALAPWVPWLRRRVGLVAQRS